MVCAKHKETYDVSCAKCDAEEKGKESRLVETLGKSSKAVKWNDNPAYTGGRRYRPEFRTKVMSAMTFITRAYKNNLDPRKLADLDHALKNNLDDIFAVAKDDQEWTNVVHALGGQHNDKVYGTSGNLLGVMQSFGCTTYSRVEVNADTKLATGDQYVTMMAMLNDSKRIYLHGTEVHLSTVVHEMLHFFCHKQFYDAFAKPGVGAEWKALNEGITEYLTREAYTGDNHGSYEEEFQKVKLLLSAGLTKEEIAAAYFSGKIDALVEKMKAGEIKTESMQKTDPRMASAFSAAAGRRRGGPPPSNTGGTNPDEQQ